LKILITGGSGFVGRYIATELVRSNYQVVTPTHAEMDCSDLSSVKTVITHTNPEMIIHTAAFILPTDEMKGNHEMILQRNEAINKNILQQAALQNVKNIFCFGSHTMYSPGIKKNESNLLINETPNFIRGYSDSKRLLLQECQQHCSLGLNYKMLVLPSIYGPFNLDSSPKQMLNSIILRAIRLTKEKQKILDVRGNVTALREYIFLPDVCNWISKNIKFIDKLPIALNLGTNSILPILEYYKICSKLTNLELNIENKMMDKNDNKYTEDPLDSALALNFGWGVTTSIEEGIMQTIKYIEGK
tara:strand:+ start:2119 stop:3024 length:906 start_codon:yes stop_codon:yes gene_type:complete